MGQRSGIRGQGSAVSVRVEDQRSAASRQSVCCRRAEKLNPLAPEFFSARTIDNRRWQCPSPGLIGFLIGETTLAPLHPLRVRYNRVALLQGLLRQTGA